MRNKKTFKYAAFLAVLVPFLAISLVFAEHEEGETAEESDQHETTTTNTDSSTQKPTRPELKQNGQNRMGENAVRKEEARTNMEEAKAKMRSARIAMMKRLMSNQINRSQKAIDRLSQILDRIEARREKLEDEGVNLSSIDALITKAKQQKEAAKEALGKAKSDWEDLQEASENPRGAVQTFMASMKDLKKKLIDFHKTLFDIVKAMKRAVPNPDASSDNN